MIDVAQYISGQKPTIYFTGYGFEERAVGVLTAIRMGTRFEHAVSIGSPSSFLGGSLKWRENKAFTDDCLSEISTHYHTINVSVKTPVEGILRLRNLVSANNISLDEYHIIVDITSFPKSTLFMLLRELATVGASGHLFSMAPIGYELPISIGVKDVRTMPFFGDDFDPKKRKLLIEILGFEGQRSYAVWEVFDPHKTIALIGRPARANSSWRDMAIRQNELVLSRPNVETREISFVDIGAARDLLEHVYEEEHRRYNIIVSCLGTKLSAVAMFYFANSHRDVFVGFSRPEAHTEHCSYGCGKMTIMSFDARHAEIVAEFNMSTE